jgi:hypothetical protein
MELWNWLIANPAKVTAGIVLVLKWTYNAWTTNVTFPQFVRQFIGEAIQESPTSTALTALAPPERKAVLLLRASETEHATEPSK